MAIGKSICVGSRFTYQGVMETVQTPVLYIMGEYTTMTERDADHPQANIEEELHCGIGGLPGKVPVHWYGYSESFDMFREPGDDALISISYIRRIFRPNDNIWIGIGRDVKRP